MSLSTYITKNLDCLLSKNVELEIKIDMKKQDFIVLAEMFQSLSKSQKLKLTLGTHFNICGGICIYYNKFLSMLDCNVLNDHNFKKKN